MTEASPQHEPEVGDADPATIGLFVYFALLILTVAALLVLPALL
jgi:hypothetical protein